MERHNFNHATLAFITCCILVLAYELSFYSGQLPVAVFWIPFVAAIALVTWQCTMVQSSRSRTVRILAEVLALGFLAHMLFVIPVRAGVIGRDVLDDHK